MRMVQWKSGCDYYLLSYEQFFPLNLPYKMGLKKCFLPKKLECRFGPRATVTSLKVTWNGDPDQALQGKRLCSRNLLCTQRSHPFLNAEKWFIFVIFFKGGFHKNTLESFNFTNG